MEHLETLLKTKEIIEEYVSINKDKLLKLKNALVMHQAVMKDLELPGSKIVSDIVVTVLLESVVDDGGNLKGQNAEAATIRLLKEKIAQLEAENRRLKLK